jgi:hypothetical protein
MAAKHPRREFKSGGDRGFWASKEHEIDFVTPDKDFIEVKRGKASPIDFGWFSKVFPRDRLTVICSSPFKSRQVTGVTIEEFFGLLVG